MTFRETDKMPNAQLVELATERDPILQANYLPCSSASSWMNTERLI